MSYSLSDESSSGSQAGHPRSGPVAEEFSPASHSPDAGDAENGGMDANGAVFGTPPRRSVAAAGGMAGNAHAGSALGTGAGPSPAASPYSQRSALSTPGSAASGEDLQLKLHELKLQYQMLFEALLQAQPGADAEALQAQLVRGQTMKSHFSL